MTFLPGPVTPTDSMKASNRMGQRLSVSRTGVFCVPLEAHTAWTAILRHPLHVMLDKAGVQAAKRGRDILPVVPVPGKLAAREAQPAPLLLAPAQTEERREEFVRGFR